MNRFIAALAALFLCAFPAFANSPTPAGPSADLNTPKPNFLVTGTYYVPPYAGDDVPTYGYKWKAVFPAAAEQTQMSVVVFDRPMSSDEVLVEMLGHGLRPATQRELLLFAVKVPEVRLEGQPLIALGSTTDDPRVMGSTLANHQGVFSLYYRAAAGKYECYFPSILHEWPAGVLFVAVPVQASELTPTPTLAFH